MTAPLDDAFVSPPLAASENFSHVDDELAREQLKDGAHEISDAAADVAGSISNAATMTLDDIADTARTMIRDNPLVAIAAVAGVAYLLARITR